MPTKPDEAHTLICDSIIFHINSAIQLTNFKTHAPSRKLYFLSHMHNLSLFMTPIHEISKIKWEKMLPALQHSLATASLYRESKIYAINISISWPPLVLILSPQRSQAGSWGKMLVSDFRHPGRVGHGQLWSLAHYLFKLATITYG